MRHAWYPYREQSTKELCACRRVGPVWSASVYRHLSKSIRQSADWPLIAPKSLKPAVRRLFPGLEHRLARSADSDGGKRLLKNSFASRMVGPAPKCSLHRPTGSKDKCARIRK